MKITKLKSVLHLVGTVFVKHSTIRRKIPEEVGSAILNSIPKDEVAIKLEILGRTRSKQIRCVDVFYTKY